MSWIISIPNWTPPSLNRMLHKHWAVAARIKAEGTDMVAYYARLACVPPAQARRRVSVEITFKSARYILDEDNAMKALLDGLKEARVLVDDRPEFCERGKYVPLVGKAKMTRIILEDA